VGDCSRRFGRRSPPSPIHTSIPARVEEVASDRRSHHSISRGALSSEDVGDDGGKLRLHSSVAHVREA